MSRQRAGRTTRWFGARSAAVAIAVATALVGGACAAPQSESSGGIAEVSQVNDTSDFEGVEFPQPLDRPHFALTDHTGAPYDFFERTSGVPTVLYFGYTHCPDVCPLVLGQLKAAIEQSEPEIREQLQVVMVTTDPANDTPEVLAAYLSKFDSTLPVKYIGLTGDLAAVEAAQTAAGVPVAEDGGKTHSTMAIYYGASDVARVAWLANTNADEIAHDLPIGMN